MQRKTIHNELAEAVGMLIVASAFAKTDEDAAARIARKATKAKSIRIQVEAAKIFLHLGKDYRHDEIRCLRMAAESAAKGE